MTAEVPPRHGYRLAINYPVSSEKEAASIYRAPIADQCFEILKGKAMLWLRREGEGFRIEVWEKDGD